MRRTIVLLLCAVSCILSAARPAPKPNEEPRLLTGHEWASSFPGGESTLLAVQAGSDPLGKHALFVDIHCGSASNAGMLLNGAVLLALPLGVELDGKPRLYWLDGGKAQYAYSMEVIRGSSATRLPDGALAQVRCLGEESLALDQSLGIAMPTDPRITDKALSIVWRMPGTVQHRPLVNPFSPADGLSRAATLRATFPLKGSAELPITVYVGGLNSTAIDAPPTQADGGPVAPNVQLEWVAWEGEVNPADVLSTGDIGATSTGVKHASAAATQQPSITADSKLIVSDSNRQTASTDLAVEPARGRAEATAQPTATPAQAKEVKPGTLALAPETYRVPLKPITGAGGIAAAPNVAATSVGPSQLSPQIGSALAAPATEMVLIPAGSFEMGSAVGPLDDRADEAPQHSVELPAYYIDKVPVTNRQFYNFVISSGYKPDGAWQKYYEPATADLPVRSVSWNDAGAYARWAGKRLPSEAEWEKAARGTDARTYPWGEDWSSEILPRTDNYYALVGSPKIASPFGVLAMCGILWQWTGSSYAAYPFNAKAGGEKKVLRGGCFSNGRNIVRCANRYAEPPAVALNTFTFRCAKDAP
ncbi:MAG: formylglycine-generating enzyme family protein [bacterium]|nr:formylglycine-generating enzyme family protein [bacterium]